MHILGVKKVVQRCSFKGTARVKSCFSQFFSESVAAERVMCFGSTTDDGKPKTKKGKHSHVSHEKRGHHKGEYK